MILHMAVTGPRVGLREVRRAHGLTLEQLADRIAEQGHKRPDANSLSNIECGNKRAGATLLTAWSRALGVHPLDVEQPYRTVERQKVAV